MEFLIFTLKRVEWHLRDHPLPFKISFSANLEFICSGEVSVPNRVNRQGSNDPTPLSAFVT